MTLREGDRVLLVDKRGRRYLIRLEAGKAFHSHHGTVGHDGLIGAEEGAAVHSSHGRRFLAFRPTLADYVLKMPRGATVVYPKDLGPILVYADVFPGARVLEAGTGSGALTLALLRAVGPKGEVISLEAREDHQRKGLRNIEGYAGGDPHLGALDARLADVYEDPLDVEVDRVILDLTEPWRALPNVRRCLRPGGIVCAYLPTIGQVQELTRQLTAREWALVETFETLQRGWNVDGLSVRPDHRMVAHTAFLVVGRRLAGTDEDDNGGPGRAQEAEDDEEGGESA